MNRILIVNVNWLGDVIFSLPIFKALKKAYPKAFVSCLAVPRVKEILDSCSWIDQVIVYDDEKAHATPWGKIKLIRQLHAQEFDTVFLLHRSLTRALLVFWAGIPNRIGYDAKGRGFLLTHKVQPRPEYIHRSDLYLNVIESFGVPVQDRTCALEISAQELAKFRNRLTEKGIGPQDFLVIVNPGGNWDLKRWPKENFGRLIERLAKEFKFKIIISGAAQDIDLANHIAASSKTDPIVLTGTTELKELLALFKCANLVITADTGPLHLAGGVGTSTIALFGPTRPEVTGPRGSGKFVVLQKDVGCNRTPCYYLDCPDNVCMKSITVEDVISEIPRFRN